MKRIGIIGGGAAGIVAAILAGEAGHQVTILESTDRIGKKILMTGNGKCNLTNLFMDSTCYYSSDPDKAFRIIKEYGADSIIDFFDRIGVVTKNKNGYVYPYCEQASVVLDALRFRLKDLGVRVCIDSKVIDIKNEQNGSLRVVTRDNSYSFDIVILTTGGQAYPKTGSDGSGYELATKLGHSIVKVVPALTALKCKEDYFKSVAGVRCEATVICKVNNVIEGFEHGELQLTEQGISGIPVFQISRVANYGLLKGEKVVVSIDLLPDRQFSELVEEIECRKESFPNRSCEELLNGLINKKVINLIMKLAGIKPSDSSSELPDKKIKTLVSIIKDWTVTVIGNNGFDNCQVCAGGVPLTEVDDELMSIYVPGLYMAGEVLDVDGKCGGYNLTWSWSSAMKVVEAITED